MENKKTIGLEQPRGVVYGNRPKSLTSKEPPGQGDSQNIGAAKPFTDQKSRLAETDTKAPQAPSSAIEALSVESTGAKTHTVKKDDTIDGLKNRLFKDLSPSKRQKITVQYEGQPERKVEPKKLRIGEKLVFTPPAKVAERPDAPPLPEAKLPEISKGFQDKIKAAAETHKFDEKAFTDKINTIARKYQMNPNALLAVINCETAGSFDPAKQNHIGATGLIQFTKTTAQELKTTTDELAKMDAVKQLDYVDKYLGSKLKNHTGELSDTDVYLSVFYPKGVGKGRNPKAVIFTEKNAPLSYKGNKSIDTDKNGEITSAEVQNRLKQWYPKN